MPQRDPKTGKQLSGSAKRKAAKQKKVSYAKAVATATAPVPGSSDFDKLSPAPLGRSAEAIAWVNDAVLIALEQVLRHPTLPCPERWKWIKDYAAVLGMVRDKAAEQVAIKKALASQQAAHQAQGTVSASGRTKKTVPRPPT